MNSRDKSNYFYTYLYRLYKGTYYIRIYILYTFLILIYYVRYFPSKKEKKIAVTNKNNKTYNILHHHNTHTQKTKLHCIKYKDDEKNVIIPNSGKYFLLPQSLSHLLLYKATFFFFVTQKNKIRKVFCFFFPVF